LTRGAKLQGRLVFYKIWQDCQKKWRSGVVARKIELNKRRGRAVAHRFKICCGGAKSGA